MSSFHKDEKKQNIPAKEKPASTEKQPWKNPKDNTCGRGGSCGQK